MAVSARLSTKATFSIVKKTSEELSTCSLLHTFPTTLAATLHEFELLYVKSTFQSEELRRRGYAHSFETRRIERKRLDLSNHISAVGLQMHRVFGHKNAAKLDISTVATNMDGRVRLLDEKIAQLNDEILKYKQQLVISKNNASIKRQAIQALQRRKMYETQRENLVAQSFNIEQAKFAVETSKDTQETVNAMKYATTVMKEDHKKINIDEIDSIHDDMVEMLEDLNEIQDSLGRSYGVSDDIDESELEAELTNLEEEWEEEKILGETSRPVPSYLQSNSRISEGEGPSFISSSSTHGSNYGVEETALPIMSAH